MIWGRWVPFQLKKNNIQAPIHISPILNNFRMPYARMHNYVCWTFVCKRKLNVTSNGLLMRNIAFQWFRRHAYQFSHFMHVAHSHTDIYPIIQIVSADVVFSQNTRPQTVQQWMHEQTCGHTVSNMYGQEQSIIVYYVC